nr:MAG TPA: hypothetical protein [Caudoviricetes sp.]
MIFRVGHAISLLLSMFVPLVIILDSHVQAILY